MFSACTSRVSVRKELSVVPSSAPKVPARVALLQTTPPRAIELRRSGEHTAIVALQPGLSRAVESALRSTFVDYSEAESPSAAKGADFLAEYSVFSTGHQSEDFVLEIREPGETPLFRKSWPSMKKTPVGNAFIGILSFIPPFYFLMPMSAASKAMRVRDAAEQSLVRGLEEFAADLRRDVPDYLRVKAQAQSAEGRGDSAAGADAAAATAGYQEALAVVDVHRTLGKRVLGKLIALSGGRSAGPVPEAAKDAMAKGKVLIGRAESPADYRAAVDAMDSALRAAPIWATGHFNAALAHEGAGDWLAATEHFTSYLALKPGAEDREEVRRKIAELKVRLEMGDKPGGR